MMDGLLNGKVAIIYGAGGSIGAAVAATFAREGASVYLAGRTLAPLEQVAKQITADGGTAAIAQVNALDEEAVAEHAQQVLAQAGRIDVSFNLTSRGDVQNVPLIEMGVDDLLRATTDGLRSQFFTARAAARAMTAQGSGVILHLNSASGDGSQPGMGSTGPADAATESLMRYLAAELGPQGVRVCGLWTAAVAESLTKEKLTAVGGPGTPDPEVILQAIAGMSALRRAPVLANVADVATFLASDRAAGITGTMTNVTAGLVLR